mmetsp:Transcript_4754/g.9041  ORF Transcript_4754/g.9041 Transcript_4754/m.9041 type:complete len:503 (-) Transcript_4754:169-1677(-)
MKPYSNCLVGIAFIAMVALLHLRADGSGNIWNRQIEELHHAADPQPEQSLAAKLSADAPQIFTQPLVSLVKGQYVDHTKSWKQADEAVAQMRARREIRYWLYDRFHPPKCSETSLVYLGMHNHGGIGSGMTRFMQQILIIFKNSPNHTIVPVGNWHFTDETRCWDRGAECYFSEDAFGCSSQRPEVRKTWSEAKSSAQMVMQLHANEKTIAYCDGLSWVHCNRVNSYVGQCYVEELGHHIPCPGALALAHEMGVPLTMLWGELLNYFLSRMRPMFRKFIEEEVHNIHRKAYGLGQDSNHLKKNFLRRRTIGMHIRGAEFNRDNREVIPPEKYINYVSNLTFPPPSPNGTGLISDVVRVIVITDIQGLDNDHAFQEANSLSKLEKRNLQFVFFKRRLFNSGLTVAGQIDRISTYKPWNLFTNDQHNKTMMVLEAFSDLVSFARCEQLIGTMSNWAFLGTSLHSCLHPHAPGSSRCFLEKRKGANLRLVCDETLSYDEAFNGNM